MTASLASRQPPASLMLRPWRARPFSKFFAFTPLWIRIHAHFAWQTFFPPMFSGVRGPFGIPSDVVFDGLVLIWMSIGGYVLWGARSRLIAAVVCLVFTIPATIALIFGPAIALILENPS
jgi:hypothetical protein